MPLLFYTPWALVAPLAGYFADRYSKRTSLIFWKVAEIGFSASSCFVTPPTKPHIMLGYAALPEEQIRDGIRRLAHVVSQPQ